LPLLAQVEVARLRGPIDSAVMREFAGGFDPVDERPDVPAARTRPAHLRRYGPTPQAFSLERRFDERGTPVRLPQELRPSRSGRAAD
jgi:hypothetical protein